MKIMSIYGRDPEGFIEVKSWMRRSLVCSDGEHISSLHDADDDQFWGAFKDSRLAPCSISEFDEQSEGWYDGDPFEHRFVLAPQVISGKVPWLDLAVYEPDGYWSA